MAGADHLMEFHVVVRGRCWGGLVGEGPRRLEAGDVIAFPQGDPHVMSSPAGLRGRATLDEYRRPRGLPVPIHLQLGPTGPEEAHIVCGFLACESRPFNPLLANLPRVLHMRAGEPGAHDGLDHLLRFAVAESSARRAGGEAVLARLSVLMFVDLVRRHLASLPEGQTGWLAGLRDATVARALAALHERPGEAWTIESPAKEAALSRSALFERFAHFVGVPPMQYLARWRMQLAAARLSGGGESIATIADAVGYESEAAFSRAFKKAVGVPPSEWRRTRTR
jgi:AraC-like DNA-binding protein